MQPWIEHASLAMRRLSRTPVFSIAAAALLGIGMAIAAAAVTLINARLFSAPLVEKRLAHVAYWEGATSMPNEVAARVATDPPRSFSRLAGYGLTRRAGVVVGGSSHTVTIEAVSGHYFTVLEARPAAGRLLGADELGTGALTAVISDRFAARAFANRDSAVGATVVVGGQRLTIVGVVRTPVRSGIVADVWVPSHVLPIDTVFGALASGTSVEQATAEVAVRYGQVGSAEPRTLIVRQGLEAPLHISEMNALFWLVSLTITISLTASTSFGLLLYARLVAAQSDFAIRVALGATTRDLTRLLASEVVILGAAGTCVAVWVGGLLARFVLSREEAATGWHIAANTTADWRVFAVVALITLLVVAVVVARLAWSLARVEALGSVVAVGGMGGATIRTAGSSSRLVLAQSAATATLLYLAVVLTRSAMPDLRPSDTLPRDGTVIAWVDRTGQPPEVMMTRARSVWQTASENPEINASTLVSGLPGGVAPSPSRVRLADGRYEPAGVYYVGAQAFGALDRAVTRGRLFTEDEDRTGAAVAVVAQAAAARLWPGRDPLGKHLIVTTGRGTPTDFVVIGEVSNAAADDANLAGYSPRDVYLPFEHLPTSSRIGLLLRSARPADMTADYLAASLQSALPDVAFLSIASLDRDRQERNRPDTALSGLLWVLGAIVFVVAMGGLYGLMAYLAAMRQREFGIRKALGATLPLLCRMLAKETSRVVAPGIALGIVFGVMLGLLFTRRNVPLHLLDPMAIVLVPAGLYVSGVIGAILPYLRSIRSVNVRLRE